MGAGSPAVSSLRAFSRLPQTSRQHLENRQASRSSVNGLGRGLAICSPSLPSVPGLTTEPPCFPLSPQSPPFSKPLCAAGRDSDSHPTRPLYKPLGTAVSAHSRPRGRARGRLARDRGRPVVRRQKGDSGHRQARDRRRAPLAARDGAWGRLLRTHTDAAFRDPRKHPAFTSPNPQGCQDMPAPHPQSYSLSDLKEEGTPRRPGAASGTEGLRGEAPLSTVPAQPLRATHDLGVRTPRRHLPPRPHVSPRRRPSAPGFPPSEGSACCTRAHLTASPERICPTGPLPTRSV